MISMNKGQPLMDFDAYKSSCRQRMVISQCSWVGKARVNQPVSTDLRKAIRALT